MRSSRQAGTVRLVPVRGGHLVIAAVRRSDK
jgi:hypothetical protein